MRQATFPHFGCVEELRRWLPFYDIFAPAEFIATSGLLDTELLLPSSRPMQAVRIGSSQDRVAGVASDQHDPIGYNTKQTLRRFLQKVCDQNGVCDTSEQAGSMLSQSQAGKLGM